MIEIHPHLFVGNDVDCRTAFNNGFAIVHACKDPCHRRAVGYQQRALRSDHPYYLTYHTPQNLFLNIIDPDKPMFLPPLFQESLEFIEEEIKTRKVLIHCNKGESRAPSIAVLYLAKRAKVLPEDSFKEAALEFRKTYPCYAPGLGIQRYLGENWERFA